MGCVRCGGLVIIEYLDAEPVQRCLLCANRIYPPLPSTPARSTCYYCRQQIPPHGKVSCAACDEKSKAYRKEHPRRKKIGPQLPVVQEA